MFGGFPVTLLLLISNLIPLWLENIFSNSNYCEFVKACFMVLDVGCLGLYIPLKCEKNMSPAAARWSAL